MATPHNPHKKSVTPRNILFGYDEGLGIDPIHIDYVKQNHIIQSRISPQSCYLIQRASGGIPVGYSGAQIEALSEQYVSNDNQFRLVLWEGGSNHPDTRPYVSDGEGNIFIYINGVLATRVISIDDIKYDTEFSVEEDKTKIPNRVNIVFNIGFDPTIHAITYHYFTWEDSIDDVSIQRGDSLNQSLFGWNQYISSRFDYYKRQNQILVRFPINLNDIVISDEGKVIIENRDSWMVWYPYVNDFDILIVAPQDSPDGLEHRYEIVNSTDSVIQRQLVSQRFKLNLLEETDDRYSIPYRTVA